MRSDSPRLRIAIIGIVAVSLFAALFARLWYLQVLATEEFQVQATANQRREIIEPAPRGRILDRNGVVLVDNRLSFVASLDRQVLRELDDDERTGVLERLVTELAAYPTPNEPPITVAVLEQRLRSDRFSPYTPVPVAEDISEELAVYLTEHSDDFLGALHVESRAIRTYPYGRVAAHVLGYVGAINDDEFNSPEIRESPLRYQLTDEIGKSGVELTYESELRGQTGLRILEVDAEGDTVQELPGGSAPVAGHDIVLTIDVNEQAVAEQALREELDRARGRPVRSGPAQLAPAGSVVVLDPADGSVVAMASYPDYDPSAFSDGIDQVEWDFLRDPANHNPFINRAIEGQYAPGSTFKLITAYAALSNGLLTPETPWPDGGIYRIPNCTGDSCIKRNAGSRSYGRVDLRRALTVSSDTYFYDIGARFWFGRDEYGDGIQAASELFGLGTDTLVPLPNEKAGRVMTPEEYAERHEDNPEAFPDGVWQAGDNVNIAIGQGEMLTTPIQLANAYAALGNGGTLFAPNIAREVREAGSDVVTRTFEPRIVRQITFDPAWHAALMEGFVGVTTSGEGTATGSFLGFPFWTVAGKTGTAQVGGRADTAVFVGMGDVSSGATPRYVAAAFLEESGFGGVAAAPLVRRIFEPLADPSVMPTVTGDTTSPFGYTLSTPLVQGSDPLSEGDVLD